MPEDELDDLYQDTIVDYYQHPCCYGPLKSDEVIIEHENPLCGDMIQLWVELQQNKIVQIKWYGHGCVISQSSASMMAEFVQKLSVKEVMELSDNVIKMLRGEKYHLPEDIKDDLESLKGVIKFPVRVKCASLAWNVIQDALKKLNPSN